MRTAVAVVVKAVGFDIVEELATLGQVAERHLGAGIDELRDEAIIGEIARERRVEPRRN